MGDYIDRQEAMALLMKKEREYFNDWERNGNDSSLYAKQAYGDSVRLIYNLPQIPLTLYGYNIVHLELIAKVLQKEGLPPEKVVEALTDISRIIGIITDELENTLRASVNECFSKSRLKTMCIEDDMQKGI